MSLHIPNILFLSFLIICHIISIRKRQIYISCITQFNSRYGCILFTHALSAITIALGTWNLTETYMLFPFITISIGLSMASHRIANKVLIFAKHHKWPLLIIPIISIFIWNINPFPLLLLLLLLVTATRFYCPLG